MPKTEIDYSNTIIYKITCKDANVNDVYVGHTTNFVQRKHSHKQSCINMKSLSYKSKVYEVIRNNGGWNNWKMEIINFFNCRDHYEARQKEQEYFVSLNATLNSIEPMPKPKINTIKVTENKLKNTFYCEKCNIHCDTAKLFEIHNNTKKHNILNFDSKYYCKYCDYRTCKKCNYDTHIKSARHTKITNDYNMGQNSAKIQSKFSQNSTKEKFICSCGKEYQHRQGLWKHSKNCKFEDKNTETNNEKNEITDKELIMMVAKQNADLIKDNNELRTMIMKVIENGTHNTTNNNTHTNSHNKAFNLNFFLNETCKDAMNIMDFVDSIKLQLSDLEGVGELGYVEGISKIIVKNLKELDVTQRPVHCTDKKRETMYIKDDDKWEKDDEKLKLHKVVRRVAFKNQNLIPKFKEAHPDCGKYHSKFSDQYNKIVVESMGGPGDNDFEKEEKIIQKISREVMVEK
jgi:hypothetical protein